MVKISNSLARSFAKAVIIQNGNDNTSKTMYGTVVQDEGVNYVQIDGSTELTPFSSVMDAVPGNRVSVTIDKGKATIVGNVSAPAQNTANFPQGSVNTACLYGPIDGDTLTIKNINASNIKSGTIDASLITVTNIDADSIKAGAITTEHISTDGLNASVIKTGKLSGDRIDAHTITSDHISTNGLSANVIKTGTLDASQVTVSNLSASVIQTGTLDASKANITNINASNITTGTLDGTKATITNINASNINTGTLNASLIKTGTLDASQATITNINANNITTGKLSGNRIDSHTITSDHISTSGLNASVIESTSLNSAVGNVIRAVVDTALIRELVAGDITSLSTSTQNLIIGNGDYGTIEVNGTLIQFKDNTQNHNVYIQLGKDAQGNNSLIVKNQNGATILDSSGITANAIADELIVNDMLKQKDANYTGISANRLNIDSVVTGINNGTSTINTSKIYFDEGSQTLNTKLSSMTSDISGINTNLSTNYYTKTETTNQVNSIIGSTTITRDGQSVNMLTALNNVIDTAEGHTQTISSINTALGTKASASQTITSDTIHYLATSLASGVTTSTSGWSTEPQTMTSTNKYLWIYHTYTYADNTSQNPHTSNTTPVIGGVYGNTGAQGNPGTSVTVSSIQYAASASNTTAPTSGWQTSIPSVSAGQYLWTKTTYSDNNVAYSVARQGSNGSNGSDGTSVTISSTSVTYQAGTSGTTKPTGTWSTSVPSVSAGQYLWTKTVVTYSDGTSTESYSVARQGANGTGVSISSTSVTYQAGTSETTAPTGNWSTTIPSVSAGQYLWTKTVVTYSNNTSTIAYSVARQGVNGTNGSDGTSVTVSSVQYAGSTSNTTAPTTGWQSSIPTVAQGSYLWTKTTYSDNNVAYSVARQGQNGSNGTSVTISSTSITYQTSSSGTTTPNGTWSTSIPSVSAGQYLWTKTYVKYSDNTETTSYSVARTGTNGTSATTYSLIVSHAAVGKSADGVYNPTAITLMSKSQTGSAALADYAGRFKIETTADNSTWTAQYTSSSNESSKSYTVPANIKSIRCSLYLAGGTTTLLDQQTVPIVSDGAQGIQGIQGVQGNPGADAYTVLLTNESHTFAGGTSAAIAGSTTIGVVGYKGATQQNTTVGTISGAPTGMTTSISNNTSKTTSVTVNVTTSMTTKNGTLTIPVTVDGKTFNLIFSYALALTGSQGPQGVSVASVETLYYAHTGTTSPTAPNSEITSTSTGTGVWTKAVPTLTATNRYMFRCDQIKYNNGGISWSTVVLDDSLTDLTSRMTTAESKITDSAIINTVASNMKNCGRNLLHGTTGAPRAATYPGSSGYNNIAEYYTSIIPTSNSYVLSFEAKSTVAGDKITNYFYDPGTTTSAVSSQGYVSTATDGATKITLTTSWVRYWIKFTQTAANTRKRVLVGRCIYGDGTGTVYIRKVQLEEGTVPTDWSVAPDEGINLTLDALSISRPTSYLCARIPLTKNLEAGKTYTLQLWGCVLDSGSSGLRAYWGGGNIALTGYINPDVNGYASVVFSVTDANASGAGAYNLWIDMYNFPNGHTGRNCTIGKWKLEEGGAATPWSPAPVQIASMTKVEQLTDKISMIVANDSTSSSVVLTPDALTAIANNINLNGKVNFNDLTASAKSSIASNTLSNIYSTGTTTIDGGKITTHTITSDHISTNGLSANVIKTGTLDASRVTVTNIDGGQITAGSISADKINTDELAVSIFESIIEEDTEWSSKAYVTFIHGDYIECGYYDSSDASLSKNVLIADHDYASLHDFEFMSCNPTRTGGVDLNKIKLPYGTKITPSRMLHFGNDEDNLTNVLKLGGAHTHTSNNSGTRGGTRGVGEEETPIIGGGIWCKGHRLMKSGEEYYKESDKSKISQIPWLSKHLCSISRSGVTVEHTMTSVTLNVTSSDNTNFQQIYNSERLSWSTLLDGDYIENKECTLCCSSITTTYSGGSGPRLYLVIYENETEGNALLSVYVSPSTTRQTFTWPSNGRYYQLIYRAEQTKGTASVNTVVVFNNPAVVIGNFTGTSVGNPSDITVSDNYIITSDGDVHLRNSNIDALIMNNVYDNDLQCISGLYGMTTTRHLGYDASTHHNLIPTMATLAFWNGRYNSSSSKLAYCNKGAFGTMATKNTVTATITGFTQGNLDTYSLGPNVFTKVGSFSVPAGKGILIVTIRTGSNTNVRGYMGISGNASATSLERGYFSDFTATAQGTDYAASATVTTPFNHSAATTWYIYMKTNASANIYPHYSYQLLAPTIGYT